MRPEYLKFLSVTAILLALGGCLGNAEETTGGYPPPAVAVMDVVPAATPVVREYVGRTMGSREVEIHARITGLIEKRLYDEGSVVTAGAPLFRIDPRPFEVRVASAEADRAHARAQYARVTRERERLEPLVSEDAVSQKEVDDARSDVALAAATVQQADAALRDAKIQLSYTTVTAPITGVTGIAEKFEGALVTEGSDSRLTSLVQVDPIDVHFSISENEWLEQQSELASGALVMPEQAKLDVRIITANGTTLERVGHINFSAASIDEATGTYNLRARFPNKDGMLKAGQFVRVQVSGAERPDAVTVPQKAVLEGPQGKFVFVVGKGEGNTPVAEIRPITVGQWLTTDLGQVWLVRTGLQAGDQVILDNFVKLQPGAPVTMLDQQSTPKSETVASAR